MNTGKTINFILVDAHPIVRDGIEALLLSEDDFDSFGTASDAREAIALVRSKPPDVALVDVCLPNDDGFRLLSDLRREFPSVRVIMLAGTPLLSERNEARIAGARGYVSKGVSLARLVELVRCAVRDPSAFVEDVWNGVSSPLSARELQVLKQFSTGKTRVDVAKALGLGPETIKSHTRVIMRKLGVPNTLAAVTTVIRMGLIRP